jgi:hypothetical protein
MNTLVPDQRIRSYLTVTRSASYGFLAALPLFLAYEILILLVNQGSAEPVRVGADLWIKRVIAMVGGPGMFVVGLVAIGAGVAILVAERKRKLPWRPAWFGWMVVESTVYAVLVAALVVNIVQGLFYAMVPESVIALQETARLGLGRMLALSLGAGLYEELLFRVILVGGLAWLLTRVVKRRNTAYAVAAVVGALLFSTVHYIGAFGDPFTLPSFTFRFLFGLALNALYLARGFGIAAWTHALYDVMVVSRLLT